MYTRKIIRYNFPGEEHSTTVHIYPAFLRDGPPVLVSAWIPLGPATVEMKFSSVFGRVSYCRRWHGRRLETGQPGFTP
jgi:hypothetical protein